MPTNAGLRGGIGDLAICPSNAAIEAVLITTLALAVGERLPDIAAAAAGGR
jgi:hypothetical protein